MQVSFCIGINNHVDINLNMIIGIHRSIDVHIRISSMHIHISIHINVNIGFLMPLAWLMVAKQGYSIQLCEFPGLVSRDWSLSALART